MAAIRFFRFSNMISAEQLASLSKTLPAWTLAKQEDYLTRTYSFEDGRGAYDFISLVSKIAQQYETYPELHAFSRAVTVRLAYRSVGGLNEGDFKLAKFMDKAEAHVNRQEDF